MIRRRAFGCRTTTIAIVVVLQLLATMFFLLDAAGDLQRDGVSADLGLEGAAAVALLAGVLFGAMQLSWLVRRARQDEAAVAVAKGAMADLVRLRFEEWRLTPAAAAGTVRAQLARVYAKAGVRSQVALMVEELVDPEAIRSERDASPPVISRR
jgi:hypothetical protein